MPSSPLIKLLEQHQSLERLAVREVAGKSISYKHLYQRARAFSAGLVANGFKTNDRVLLLVKPGVDATVAVIGVLLSGGCVVVADPGTGRELFARRVQAARPQWTIIDSRLAYLAKKPSLLALARRLDAAIPDIVMKDLPKCIYSGKAPKGSLSMHAIENQGVVYEACKISPANIGLIVFTSGTTSEPKGVQLTHKNIAASLELVKKMLISDSPTLYTNQPYFLLLGIGVGASVIINAKPFTPKRFLADSKAYSPNVIFGPPGEFLPLIEYCKKTKQRFPSSYLQVLFGSAPITKAFLKNFYSIANKSLTTTCMYGMTEAIPIAVVDGREKIQNTEEGDFLGELVSGIKATLGKDGELFVQGPNVMKSYIGQPPRSFIATGDIVSRQGNRLFLLSRKKDMILRRSYNIYPGLYETTIGRIPGVIDCALIGVFSEELQDEQIILVVETAQGSNLDERTLRRKLIAGPYSIDAQALPDRIVFRKLPRSGRQSKIDKQRLRNEEK